MVYPFGNGFRSPAWLHGLANPQIKQAMEFMHGNLEHGWTVRDLANAVSMPRSSFARTFMIKVWQPPLSYLTQWRLARAGAVASKGEELMSVIL